jgi:hypothetical protein
MKTLDLDAYGVKEMNVNEMEKVDGGGWREFFQELLVVTIFVLIAVAFV